MPRVFKTNKQAMAAWFWDGEEKSFSQSPAWLKNACDVFKYPKEQGAKDTFWILLYPYIFCDVKETCRGQGWFVNNIETKTITFVDVVTFNKDYTFEKE